MELTGLIFAAIAVAWLVYLIPLFLRRRGGSSDDELTEEVAPFADSMRIVRTGTAPLVDVDGVELPSVEVSTPLTRRAAIFDLRRRYALAARRRRRVLVGLAVLATAVLVVCALELLPWLALIGPAGLIVGFVLVSRASVIVLQRHLDERLTAIRSGGEEATVFLARPAAQETSEPSAKATPAKPSLGSLWEPLPITMPTYVSKPLAPRTVRTIDLSGPGVTSSGRGTALGTGEPPVTADAPLTAVPAEASSPFAGSAEPPPPVSDEPGEQARAVG